MSPDLDLPVLMSADHIRRREFVAIRRGYDPAQVRDFLDHVADQVQEMEALLREARLEAETATRASGQPRTDPYAQLAERVASVLRSADDEAERSRGEASAEASRILAEARSDAERIRADAQARADETRAAADTALREAREQAHRTIAGLATRRDVLVEELATMQERLVGVARDLESTIAVPQAAGIPPADAEAAAFLARSRAEAFVRPAEEPGERKIILDEATADADAAKEPDAAEEPEDDLDDEARMELLDPSFQELWDGTSGIPLDLPDIPPLDLDWGEVEEQAEDEG